MYEEWRKSAAAARIEAKNPRPVSDGNLVETHIGSGSDFTVFLNFLCRPTVELEFDGPYGVYHSAYDNFFWMNHFGDPGYRYHTLMSQLWGSLALRLANADVLPYALDEQAASLREFVRALDKIPNLTGNLDTSPLVERTRALRVAARRLDHRVNTALAAGTLAPDAANRLNQAIRGLRGELGPSRKASQGARGSSTCSTRPATPMPR